MQLTDTGRSKNRDRTSIMIDVLKVARNYSDGIKITHLMYQANLNYRMTMDIVRYLMKRDMIAMLDAQEKLYYKITEKGIFFLDTFEKFDLFKK